MKKDRITIILFHKGFLWSRNNIMMLFYCFKVKVTCQVDFRSKKGKKEFFEPEITQVIFMETTKRLELQNPIK